MPDRETIHTPPSTIHNIAFVYFDLDDTLLDHRRAERAALADLKRRFGAQLGEVSEDTICTGRITRTTRHCGQPMPAARLRKAS